MNNVSNPRSSLRFVFAIWDSYSKSRTARKPRRMVFTPSCWANFTKRPLKVLTLTRLSPPSAPLSSSTRSSTENTASLAGFLSTATRSPSNSLSPRWMMLRWPCVGGSKEPGYRAMRTDASSFAGRLPSTAARDQHRRVPVTPLVDRIEALRQCRGRLAAVAFQHHPPLRSDELPPGQRIQGLLGRAPRVRRIGEDQVEGSGQPGKG